MSDFSVRVFVFVFGYLCFLKMSLLYIPLLIFVRSEYKSVLILIMSGFSFAIFFSVVLIVSASIVSPLCSGTDSVLG